MTVLVFAWKKFIGKRIFNFLHGSIKSRTNFLLAKIWVLIVFKAQNRCLLMQKLIFSSSMRFCFGNVSIFKDNSSVTSIMNSDFWSHFKCFCVISIPAHKRLISDRFNSKLFFFSPANARRDLRFSLHFWSITKLF